MSLWLDGTLLAVLLLLLPILSLAQVHLVAEVEEVDRLPAYMGSTVFLAGLGAVAWWVGAYGVGAPVLGLVGLPLASLLGWTGATVAAGLGVTLAFRQAGARLGARESPLLRRLIPRTGRERGAFVLLSLAAGVGEELAYRGFLIGVVAPVAGPVWAASLSSVAFGLCHAYQGLLGVVRTTVQGGVFAWVFLASGSLWPGMAAHAILDVLLGIFLAERFMVPEPGDGVEDSDAAATVPGTVNPSEADRAAP